MSSHATAFQERPRVGAGDLALRVEDLSKTFPGTRALIDVSLDIRAGEVHALVGQNGSGKSTLIKTLAGLSHARPGRARRARGRGVRARPRRARGLRFVHQDLGLVLELNAMDNLALRGGFISGARPAASGGESRSRRPTGSSSASTSSSTSTRPLAEATPVQRTVVAIAGAMQGWQGGGGVLVLDEPTAVLPHDEVEHLLEMVREVQRGGTSVLYVSHRLDEIFEIADRVTVLRAGRVVTTLPVSEVDNRSLAKLMVGEDVDPDFRAPVAARPDSPVVLEVRDVRGHRLHGVDLDVHRGEILGIAGLAGDGVLELPYVMAGQPRHPATGTIRLPQISSEWTDVAQAFELGIALVPADRAREAVIPDFSVGENLTISVLDRLSSRGKLGKAAERELVERWTDRLGIVTAGSGALIATLSGGNQQKVVVARCLARDPALLVLVRADGRSRHRHARRDLRADRRARTRRPDGGRVFLGPGRPACDVHANRRAQRGTGRRRARRRGTY